MEDDLKVWKIEDDLFFALYLETSQFKQNLLLSLGSSSLVFSEHFNS
jgi:hypothetical protein